MADQSTAMVPDGYELVEKPGGGTSTPSAGQLGGYWEKRGIAGDVWHPSGGGNPELHREDNSLFGVPPELAVAGAIPVARAVGGAVGVGQKALAGAHAAMGETVGPWLKYEGARHMLKAMGLPEAIATPLAYMFMVKTGGGRGVAAEAETAAPKNVTPTAPVETPLELTRRLKAENIAKHAATAPEAAAPSAQLTPYVRGLSDAAKLPAEMRPIYDKLLSEGNTPDQALLQIEWLQKLGGGSLGEVAAKARTAAYEASGKKYWPKAD